jgi:hemerythrin
MFYVLDIPKQYKYWESGDSVLEYKECPIEGAYPAGRKGPTTKILKSPKGLMPIIETAGGYLGCTRYALREMRRSGITGWRLSPWQVKVVPRGIRRKVPPYYEIEIVGKGGSIAHNKGVKLKEVCPGCGRKRYTSPTHGIHVDKKQWDGSDLFYVDEVGELLCSEKFARMFRRKRFRGLKLIPAPKWKDPMVDPTVWLLEDMPPRGRAWARRLMRRAKKSRPPEKPEEPPTDRGFLLSVRDELQERLRALAGRKHKDETAEDEEMVTRELLRWLDEHKDDPDVKVEDFMKFQAGLVGDLSAMAFAGAVPKSLLGRSLLRRAWDWVRNGFLSRFRRKGKGPMASREKICLRELRGWLKEHKDDPDADLADFTNFLARLVTRLPGLAGGQADLYPIAAREEFGRHLRSRLRRYPKRKGETQRAEERFDRDLLRWLDEHKDDPNVKLEDFTKFVAGLVAGTAGLSGAGKEGQPGDLFTIEAREELRKQLRSQLRKYPKRKADSEKFEEAYDRELVRWLDERKDDPEVKVEDLKNFVAALVQRVGGLDEEDERKRLKT